MCFLPESLILESVRQKAWLLWLKTCLFPSRMMLQLRSSRDSCCPMLQWFRGFLAVRLNPILITFSCVDCGPGRFSLTLQTLHLFPVEWLVSNWGEKGLEHWTLLSTQCFPILSLFSPQSFQSCKVKTSGQRWSCRHWRAADIWLWAVSLKLFCSLPSENHTTENWLGGLRHTHWPTWGLIVPKFVLLFTKEIEPRTIKPFTTWTSWCLRVLVCLCPDLPQSCVYLMQPTTGDHFFPESFVGKINFSLRNYFGPLQCLYIGLGLELSHLS